MSLISLRASTDYCARTVGGLNQRPLLVLNISCHHIAPRDLRRTTVRPRADSPFATALRTVTSIQAALPLRDRLPFGWALMSLLLDPCTPKRKLK